MALLKRKRSGLNDPMSVVTRFVNACNRHDADGVSGCLHPDFDSIQPMFPSRNFRGADQVRRNWQAIFDAEPGFRLTVLRSAAVDDTVWLELHGAGRDAEVAGVFVMGIQGDRVRWARIYSSLVEPVAEGDGAAPRPGGAGGPESPVAPVVDIERSGRRRRRSGRRRGQPTDAPATGEPGAEPATGAAAEPSWEAVPEPLARTEPVDSAESAVPAGSEDEPDVAGDERAAAPRQEAEPEPDVLVWPATEEPSEAKGTGEAPSDATAEATADATAAFDVLAELAQERAGDAPEAAGDDVLGTGAADEAASERGDRAGGDDAEPPSEPKPD